MQHSRAVAKLWVAAFETVRSVRLWLLGERPVQSAFPEQEPLWGGVIVLQGVHLRSHSRPGAAQSSHSTGKEETL